MTFNQQGWTVTGDVYNVGHDLILTRHSSRTDFARGIAMVREDVERETELPEQVRDEILADLNVAEQEASKAEPSKDVVVAKLDRVRGRVVGLGTVITSMTALGGHLSALVDWATKFAS